MRMPFTTAVLCCARCGEDHLTPIEFNVFVRPPADATHWGTCPSTNDPILMLVRQVQASVPAEGTQQPERG
jgi:hypothetical protein